MCEMIVGSCLGIVVGVLIAKYVEGPQTSFMKLIFTKSALIISACMLIGLCVGAVIYSNNYNSYSGGGSSSHHSTATCKSCGRSYEAGDSGGNYKNIARTGMCNNCYNNFQWGQKAIGK